MGHEVVTKKQEWRDASGVRTKEAELANTYDMPQSPSPSEKNMSKKPLGVINKTASVAAEEDELLKEAFVGIGVGIPVGGAEHQRKWGTSVNVGLPHLVGVTVSPGGMKRTGIGLGLGLTGPLVSWAPGTMLSEMEHQRLMKQENPTHAPQTTLKPRVDVAGKEAPKAMQVKKASYYALPYDELYPLDSYPQVVKAASYFDETGVLMTPPMRHEYCRNMVKRANALGIPVSELAERYGSETYATPEQIKIALDARRSILKDDTDIEMLDKVASVQPLVGPEDFAVLLSEFDKQACIDEFWGNDVPDPYLSTFGKTAAEVSKTDPESSIIIGNEYTTERKLVDLAKHKHEMICEKFGKDFSKEFARDPKSIFDSMPRDQKLVLMRMANNSDSTTFGASTS